MGAPRRRLPAGSPVDVVVAKRGRSNKFVFTAGDRCPPVHGGTGGDRALTPFDQCAARRQCFNHTIPVDLGWSRSSPLLAVRLQESRPPLFGHLQQTTCLLKGGCRATASPLPVWMDPLLGAPNEHIATSRPVAIPHSAPIRDAFLVLAWVAATATAGSDIPYNLSTEVSAYTRTRVNFEGFGSTSD